MKVVLKSGGGAASFEEYIVRVPAGETVFSEGDVGTEMYVIQSGTVDIVKKVKDDPKNTRLMGFGHRVYKNFDPRAKIIKSACHTVLSKLGLKDPLLDIAVQLEEVALKDPYFVERKLYPNVDFYSGIIMRAARIPMGMFPVMFAIGRMPGWIANWREVNLNAKSRIYRPRQVYTGPTERSYVKLADRVRAK